jgi:hypothetical protein
MAGREPVPLRSIDAAQIIEYTQVEFGQLASPGGGANAAAYAW